MNIHSNNSRQTSERLMSLDVICFLFLCVVGCCDYRDSFALIGPCSCASPLAGNKCHAEPINGSAAIFWVIDSIRNFCRLFEPLCLTKCFSVRAVQRGKLLNICQKSERREYFVRSTVDFPGLHVTLLFLKKLNVRLSNLGSSIHFCDPHRATNQSTWRKQQKWCSNLSIISTIWLNFFRW